MDHLRYLEKIILLAIKTCGMCGPGAEMLDAVLREERIPYRIRCSELWQPSESPHQSLQTQIDSNVIRSEQKMNLTPPLLPPQYNCRDAKKNCGSV
jgi:hypothetical protein